TPTIISAADVAAPGISATSGDKNRASKKQIPVVTAVRPVRPPCAIPEELSTKAVTVLVPSTAPPLTPIASTTIALPTRFLPSTGSVMIPAFVAVPTSVPKASNSSTDVKVRITVIRPTPNTPAKSTSAKCIVVKSGIQVLPANVS